DPKEDPADYPADEGDDGDDEDESSDDDEDEDVDIEGDEKEEEHPAPVDSKAVALPAVDHAPSAKETEPFETDESAATPPPHPAYRVTARMSIRDEPPIPFWSEAELPDSLPYHHLHHHHFPYVLSPLLVSPPLPIVPPPLLVSPTYLLGYRVAMIRLRAEAPSTSHLPPPHIILPHQSRYTTIRADRPEVTLPPQKRLGIALGLRYEDGMLEGMPRELATDETEIGHRVTNLVMTVRQDTDEIYTRLDDAQGERKLLSGRLNMLFRDRRTHARTTRLMEMEARIS
ncbi:hypothetical protein Tco_1351914, partial [Tanacetum coccineum]